MAAKQWREVIDAHFTTGVAFFCGRDPAGPAGG
jgi:hypothetical protein